MYLYDNGNGISMTSMPEFCAGAKGEDSKHCVTNFPSSLKDCVRHLYGWRSAHTCTRMNLV